MKMKTKTKASPRPRLAGKTFIAVDVSGSAQYSKVERGLKQAESIARALGVQRAAYLAFDHEIEFEKLAKLGSVSVAELSERGGCGTNFHRLFERLMDCPNPALMIVVTDMLGPFPEKNPVPKATIIWLDTEGAEVSVPPFGLYVRKDKE